MRTTLDIDEEVLRAVKEIGQREHRTAGAVVSDLLRQALTRSATPSVSEPEPFYGFRPFAAEGRIVSNTTVERLMDEEGI